MQNILDCEAFGVPFRLAGESEELLEMMVRDCAPWGSAVCERPHKKAREFAVRQRGTGYCIIHDDEAPAQHATLGAALDDLARELMVHVAERAPDRVFVHAGVVAWRGRGLALPGRSFAGKTTLVAELVRAGATYYSDEYAVLDADGRVHPYARRLGVRVPGGVEQRRVTVEVLGGLAGHAPVRAAMIAFVQYAEGGRWEPEPMPAGMAALEMLRHAVPVRRTPGRVMAALAKMMEGAEVVRSERGEAAETARLLLATMKGYP